MACVGTGALDVETGGQCEVRGGLAVGIGAVRRQLARQHAAAGRGCAGVASAAVAAVGFGYIAL